jgi:hypothetical protein
VLRAGSSFTDSDLLCAIDDLLAWVFGIAIHRSSDSAPTIVTSEMRPDIVGGAPAVRYGGTTVTTSKVVPI